MNFAPLSHAMQSWANSDIYALLYPLFLLLLLLLLLILKKHIQSPTSRGQTIPPGPRPWPILGNAMEIGFKPHVSLSNLARVHGPLISLRLGSQLLVVASSPAAATEVLKSQDRLLSGRCAPQAFPISASVLERSSFIWAPECTERWKLLRALCRNELLSAKVLETGAALRERKTAEVVEFLGEKEGKVMEIGEVVHTLVSNVLSNLCFSKDFIDLRGGVGREFKEIVSAMKKLVITPNVADLYPGLLGKLDPQGLRRKALECHRRLIKMWGVIIRDRRERNNGLDQPRDFLDVLIANGFTDEQIVILISELFGAGTESVSITIEWAMTELLINKDAMEKLSQEIKTQTTTDSIKESDLSKLPYLHACVKETLRIHAPTPFLIPHRALDTCKVLNYMIPKNSQVLVNVWAIGRDSTVWEDPLRFKPERFLNSDIDFKGHDFKFLPFGSGRRQCPGLALASKQVHLILASLISSFHWCLPNGEDPSKIDMNESFGVTLQKEQPLLVIPMRKK